MNIGIIGAGAIGQAVATRAAQAGIGVLLSDGHGLEMLNSIARRLGSGVEAVTIEEAALAEIVVIAVSWPNVPSALAGLPAWSGRIVVDATNPLTVPDFKSAGFGGRTSSELVATLVPGARLVKAFNTLTPELLLSEPPAGGRHAVFLSGDDASANAEVAHVVYRMGFTAVDLGRLAPGGNVQRVSRGPLTTLNRVGLPVN